MALLPPVLRKWLWTARASFKALVDNRLGLLQAPQGNCAGQEHAERPDSELRFPCHVPPDANQFPEPGYSQSELAPTAEFLLVSAVAGQPAAAGGNTGGEIETDSGSASEASEQSEVFKQSGLEVSPVPGPPLPVDREQQKRQREDCCPSLEPAVAVEVVKKRLRYPDSPQQCRQCSARFKSSWSFQNGRHVWVAYHLAKLLGQSQRLGALRQKDALGLVKQLYAVAEVQLAADDWGEVGLCGRSIEDYSAACRSKMCSAYLPALCTQCFKRYRSANH